MPTPNPRYLSRDVKPRNARPTLSRWSTRRKALATLAAPPTPPPTADYEVTGTLTPDATGAYVTTADYDGRPTATRTDSLYVIWWWDLLMDWIISAEPANLDIFWSRNDGDIAGEYAAGAGATGTATVTAAS